MSDIRAIFEEMPNRYVSGHTDKTVVYYFSVGKDKWTVTLTPDQCEAVEGRLTDNADCVVKADPKLFYKMVTQGKKPGPIDIARGKLKSNDLALLMKMSVFFNIDFK